MGKPNPLFAVMKSLISVTVFGCLLIFTIPPVHSTSQQEESQGKGYLLLQTKHVGLSVKIDGQLIGQTPLDLQMLPTGLHKINISHPGRVNWLDRDWSREVSIAPDDTLVIEVNFERSFSINSQPFGAEVFLEDQRVGETPIFVKLLEGEMKRLTLSKTGFKDTTMILGLCEEQFFNIPLKRTKESLDFSLKTKELEFKRKSKTKRYLYTSVGLSVVSGALALYFRNKGNQNHDRYLATADPQTFNKFFDDAKKYDRYAAVSFGTFQVSFIFSFYLYLKEANR